MALDIAQYATNDVRELIDRSLRESDPGFNLPMDHWSASSLTMVRRCPEQFRQRYILGKRERPAEAPVMGSAVHAALELNFFQKIESHSDLELVDLLSWYMDHGFPQVVYDEQERVGEEVQWDTGPEATRQRGKFIVAAYHDIVAPRIQPLKVETVFRVDMGMPIPVEGRFDLERTETCIDFKTGVQKQSKPKESWRIQAGVYTEATGKPVEFHSLSASKKTNAVSVVTPLESEDLLVSPTEFERREMRRRLEAISVEACAYMARYGPDEAWPTHGRDHVWACDWCGFRPGCPAWRTT